MSNSNRRQFIATTAASAAAATLAINAASAQEPFEGGTMPGERPKQSDKVSVENPRCRVPLSFIIDDSTPLVNMAHFGIPQFQQTFPEQYKQNWRDLPREIPDSFVRKFADWCRDQGVKGKYSVVPYPACVGWVDRYMPGWTQQELRDSLKLIREELPDNWDFHPEMISHTRVIDIKTGRPYEDSSEYFMENWRWTDGKSTDQLAEYMAYALRILKNVDLPCEGITTPGGFAGRVLPQLAQGALQACRSVFNAEIPHYFRHLFTDERSVAPRVEYAKGLNVSDPECVVSIIGCTGDWFGGWDGLVIGSVDKLITEDLRGGRLPEVIDKGEPAILVCHWPGIYFNGYEVGFNIFKEAVSRVHQKYDNLIWMKNSEIARYWAAKELTAIEANGDLIELNAPFASPDYTVKIASRSNKPPRVTHQGKTLELAEAQSRLALKSGAYCNEDDQLFMCFDLKKGKTTIQV